MTSFDKVASRSIYWPMRD